MQKLLLLIIPLILFSCQGEKKTKEEVLKEVREEKKRMEAKSDSLTLEVELTTFKHLLNQLEEFYNTKEFKEKGFGEGSKYNKWYEEVEKLSNTRSVQLLNRVGITYGDLLVLGMSLISESSSNIKDNQHYQRINKGLEKLNGVEEIAGSKINSSEGLLIGKWKIDNDKANIHYTYSIYHNNDTYYGVEESKGVQKRDELKKRGNKFYIKGSKANEHYVINKSENIELYDKQGSLKDFGFVFTKIY